MTVCAACGAENPGKAKLCMECAAPLAAPHAAAKERKVVTTLLCTLVGFTAMSEAADPEVGVFGVPAARLSRPTGRRVGADRALLPGRGKM